MEVNNKSRNKTYPTINNIKGPVIKNLFINGNKKYNNLTSVPIDENPHLIIKYGPPASGKGSEKVQEEIKNLGIDIKDCIIFETDRIIESLEDYRKETKNFYNSLDKDTNYNNKLIELSSIYYKKRTTKNSKENSISNKMDDVLKESIENRKNIIFETTSGKLNEYNPILWLLRFIKEHTNINHKPYKVTLIYPLVNDDEIFRRINHRASEQLKRNPPFYRTIDKKSLKKIIENAKMNFYIYIIPMILFFNEIHKVIVFDNNE